MTYSNWDTLHQGDDIIVFQEKTTKDQLIWSKKDQVVEFFVNDYSKYKKVKRDTRFIKTVRDVEMFMENWEEP
jgi:hypothetical protein